MRYKPTLLDVVLVIIPIVLSGCFSANSEDVKAFLRPDETDVTADTYILQPPQCDHGPVLDGARDAGQRVLFIGGADTRDPSGRQYLTRVRRRCHGRRQDTTSGC